MVVSKVSRMGWLRIFVGVKMEMDMQHGHGCAAWIWTCSMDMDMQHGHGHATWTWTCSVEMDIDIDMGMDIATLLRSKTTPSRVIINENRSFLLLITFLLVVETYKPNCARCRSGCLGPEGNGVSSREGGEGVLSPPGGRKDKQSVLSKGRDNMGKDEADRTSRA